MIETYYITSETPFDLKVIDNFLSEQPYAIKLTNESGFTEFLLCGNLHTFEYTEKKRKEGFGDGYPYVGIIELSEERIEIWQRCKEDAMDQIKKFVEWVLETLPSGKYRIVDEENRDITREVQNSRSILFE